MSLIVAQHPISSAEKVPNIWLSTHNLRVNLQIYHTVWPILGWQMLPNAPPISLIHQRKDMNHFISNGCLSLQHSTPVSMLIGYPKSSIILGAIWVSTLADIALSDPWVALTCFWKLLPSTTFVKGRLWTISAAMNVSHCSTSSNFQVLRRYLKSDFFCAIWESTFRYITQCDP